MVVQVGAANSADLGHEACPNGFKVQEEVGTMVFVGQVQRLGWLVGGLGQPAAVFAFDDALVFVKLRAGASLGQGFRAGKKEQDAARALAELPGLTPGQVTERWPKALNLATADIVQVRLGPSAQGLLAGTQRLLIDVRGGDTWAFMAALAAKKPLTEVLRSVLGDRFDSGQTSQASLDALTESRKNDKS